MKEKKQERVIVTEGEKPQLREVAGRLNDAGIVIQEGRRPKRGTQDFPLHDHENDEHIGTWRVRRKGSG